MNTTKDRIIEFRLEGAMSNRLGKVGKHEPGERCLLRVSMILCLFPECRQIRTIESGWTLTVYEEDFPKVERSFRAAYLGREVKAG